MELTVAFFQPLIGQEFTARVEGADRTSRFVLTHVFPGTPRVTERAVRKEPFRLFFQGPLETHVARLLIRLSHPSTTESDLLYAEPMTLTNNVVEYEVIVG